MSVYYTYAYLRQDGTPYYIGKGKGNRCYERSHCVKVPPLDRILFLKKNLTEKEAYRHEIYLIFVIGRKDLQTGVLRNMTKGGEGGGHNKPHTEDSKRKIAEANKGKKGSNHKPFPKCAANSPGRIFTDEHRKNLSKARTGKKHTPETIAKIKKARNERSSRKI